MKVFASPSRYIQGKNALFTNAKTLKQLGNSPILLCDDVVYGIVGERFESYLIDNGMTPVHVAFNGEASDNEISRVVAIAKENGNDVIIGLGGGKTIDSAKAIADLLAVPVIIAPTIASTDAQPQPYQLFTPMKEPLKNTFSIQKIQILFWLTHK